MNHLSEKVISLKGRDLLTLLDYTPEEVQQLLTQALELKQKAKNGEPTPYLTGKSLGMIFENASTRTRVSFEVGMTQLGGHALFLSPKDLQIGRGEPIKDTANVLSRYVDAIMIRTNSHESVEELAHYATVPVINALTDAYHPCQALADALTILEKKETLIGKKLAYIGDGNNVCHSLLAIGAKTGMDVTVATPKGYEVDQEIFQRATEAAKETGATLVQTTNPQVAAENADAIYTDVWASMGYEAEQSEREEVFQPYQVNDQLLTLAKKDVSFLHCLPAHRGEEVTASVIDGPHSAIYDQAENRLHAQKAVLTALLTGE
ncbi:ornithine carbamoyltransferase [Halalkalibacterium halodurans]|uniref:ornithine carbamoyltransferase n=1 Tax=Halalkalibacterium halodurans TaxID=86665 RepID=UPI002AAA4574|nr:ornithine carbamoyltransferase [Halalkalibacterium halodurans]MDY7223447.1 ornithine carbamoyltransferase [Halalkalibacterium halodurans]MDY7242668.1 ornithine carbamoyltransferase [Halalkalibacterium halodurans]MED4081625.1 ornithine carbamoyltransferase [Halalkalibacterium halodurans]MED4084963.1 ornithine carbamoyltransferase [Halalkalibacterium halodurans]MED4104150.1 ornithine carbamoyltransferase [Halalkalibacterium halodurans]